MKTIKLALASLSLLVGSFAVLNIQPTSTSFAQQDECSGITDGRAKAACEQEVNDYTQGISDCNAISDGRARQECIEAARDTSLDNVLAECNAISFGDAREACRQDVTDVFFSIGTADDTDAVGNPTNSGSDSDQSVTQQEDTSGRIDASFTADCAVDTNAGEELNQENCAIISYIVLFVNVLSAIAGMAIIASIMIAGYQYMTARDNPGTVQKARQRIVWALIALALYLFFYAILNYLIPGGVL